MRLLHGSNVEIVTPNLKKCQSRNDFGRGFYLTPQWQRAYLMAKRQYCFCTKEALKELIKE